MTKELAEDLSSRGHEVVVMTTFPNQPLGRVYDGYERRFCQVERGKGYKIIRIWHTIPNKKKHVSRILWWFSWAISTFIFVLGQRRFDVVYAHTTPITGSFLTFAAAHLRGSAYLYGIYDIYPETVADVGMVSPESRVYRIALKIDTWVCHKVQRILTLSEGLKTTLAQRGISRDKIAVMPFWIDENELTPLPRNNDWRRENNIPDDAFVVLYAGTIGIISGAVMMADVAHRLRDVAKLLFLFVGEGPAKAGAMLRAQELDLPNMKFLPFQPRERLAEVQSAADVGVITLKPDAGKNSLPSKMLGYLACGRAVLASVDLDSDTARCIQDADCGIVTPAQDVEETARAIRKLMEPGIAADFGRRSREFFLAHYGRSSATKANEDLLLNVARSWPGRPVRRTNGKRICITGLGREIEIEKPKPVKRAVDMLVALTALVVSLPVFIPIALAVKLTSRGPVFYRGERFGRGGKVFKMFKFRSMMVDAPAILTEDGKLIVTKDDPRLTLIGKLIRRLKLDELPQLINVLIGDMALVGPRPHKAGGEEKYDDLAYEKFRVRPGVTGLASILGGRHLDVPSLERLAMRYAGRQGLWLDLKIMLLTPVYVLCGEKLTRKALGRYIEGVELNEIPDRDTY